MLAWFWWNLIWCNYAPCHWIQTPNEIFSVLLNHGEIKNTKNTFFIDGFIHLVANYRIALKTDHVSETAAFGHIGQCVLLPGVFVGHIFHKQEDENVILVLRGINATAQFIADLPE